ncbi:hypothetical protein SAMN05660420_02506 [Desulfuromusa kysingii]|uniref:Roadblock/LAMTOR2 domain-containing protein n=1 Tax=Desulfuromusa kysingii TaxID=37625 RepID=A0A1H4C9E4_9BACT|nr:hypothetical protein [Desulfuromusa kysingii]SEA57031.1 hypothetical protein SAMN05660420_02506 [Desulfuromusa kysingii]
MALILDSSEIREAIALASGLTATLNLPVATDAGKVRAITVADVPAKIAQKTTPKPSAEIDPAGLTYRGDQLEQVLRNMCLRSHFGGAVVTDATGLPFAVVNPPVSMEAVSAFTSVLGSALERAGSLLGQHGAEYLSLDINYEEKIILRRFLIHELPYFLLVICPQEVDERSEIEISIDQIVSILDKK